MPQLSRHREDLSCSSVLHLYSRSQSDREPKQASTACHPEQTSEGLNIPKGKACLRADLLLPRKVEGRAKVSKHGWLIQPTSTQREA